ncbi:MAG: hypothetical protein JETCAE02_10030 [Anaerolineaceae bacterium]|nr:DUF177 domain-containing protein [Anaerolineae bacterium]MBL1172405.1 DUF177 domain-containing protein [Chloroflexota bacterium]MDL1926699.1 DUF177 domain-containing protein [Anaerolineae bacterium AMX1]WKZ49812.1 MAG: DUF177 domain-containing protein [Anaerolineales bacterium]GJQ38591.1 MAG: hypothetical protein JETCAE02_10030 [Anaerolineaceae bacterium]
MANPRKPFRLNVGFIVGNEVGFSNEFPFDFDKVQIEDDLELRDFHGSAILGRTPQGLLLTGAFEATTSLECARCLREFDQILRWEMTELYAFNEKSVTDSDLILPDDAHIDLALLLRDYALIEIPASPICKPDCKGLCPICGQDLNQKDCGHRAEADDSPFSTLKDLLKN